MPAQPPLNYGMIGGGQGAFIGDVHRRAASLDCQTRLVCGALSTDPDRAKASALAWNIEPHRAYASYQAMLEAEAAKPESDRPAFFSIVTPNHTHHPIAKACLQAGFHVVLEKPMTHTSAQAAELRDLAAHHDLLCCVTYNYTGYPMVRQAAQIVAAGEIGAVRKVFVEYHQGWLATKAEETGLKQAEWRTDPNRAGLGGALGDIGSHAENIVAFVTGLEIDAVAADLTTFAPGRRLDDDTAVLVRYKGGAKGVLTASQVCVGEGNNLSFRIYGDKGALKWRQETPNTLHFAPLNEPTRTFTRNGPGMLERAAAAARIPEGHPEAFFEAFANIYRGAVEAILAKRAGRKPAGLAAEIPTAVDGERGVRFIEKVVESAKANSAWTPL